MRLQVALLCATALGLCATSAPAQRPSGRGPEQRAQLLFKGITLTPEQQAKVDSIQTYYREQMPSSRRESARLSHPGEGSGAVPPQVRTFVAALTADQQKVFDTEPGRAAKGTPGRALSSPTAALPACRCPLARLPLPFFLVPASDTLQARVERALSQLKNPRSGTDVSRPHGERPWRRGGWHGDVHVPARPRRPGSLAATYGKPCRVWDGVTACVSTSRLRAMRRRVRVPPPAPRLAPRRPAPPRLSTPPSRHRHRHLGRESVCGNGVGSPPSQPPRVALARAGIAWGSWTRHLRAEHPRMMGVDQKAEVRGGKIQPLEAHRVKLMPGAHRRAGPRPHLARPPSS